MKLLLMFALVLGSASCLAETETYQNPVDKQAYVAPGGWKTYKGSPGTVNRPAQKVSLAGVRLLQSQDEMASRTTPENLGDFIERVHKAASETFALYDKPATLLIQFTCVPQNCPLEISSRGDPPRELLQDFYNRVTQLTPLIDSGEVKFQFTLEVRP